MHFPDVHACPALYPVLVLPRTRVHHHNHTPPTAQLDKLNPQVASRVVRAFDSWKQYDASRKELMQAQLKRILAQEGLSANVYKIASKSASF